MPSSHNLYPILETRNSSAEFNVHARVSAGMDSWVRVCHGYPSGYPYPYPRGYICMYPRGLPAPAPFPTAGEHEVEVMLFVLTINFRKSLCLRPSVSHPAVEPLLDTFLAGFPFGCCLLALLLGQRGCRTALLGLNWPRDDLRAVGIDDVNASHFWTACEGLGRGLNIPRCAPFPYCTSVPSASL